MLHHIDDKIYHCEYTNSVPRRDRDVLLAYKDGTVLSSEAALPRLSEVSEDVPLQFLFAIWMSIFICLLQRCLKRTCYTIARFAPYVPSCLNGRPLPWSQAYISIRGTATTAIADVVPHH